MSLEALLHTIRTAPRPVAERAYLQARAIWAGGADSLRIRQLRSDITTAAALRFA